MKWHSLFKLFYIYTQELSEGEDEQISLESGPIDCHMDNSNDENDIDEETM